MNYGLCMFFSALHFTGKELTIDNLYLALFVKPHRDKHEKSKHEKSNSASCRLDIVHLPGFHIVVVTEREAYLSLH